MDVGSGGEGWMQRVGVKGGLVDFGFTWKVLSYFKELGWEVLEKGSSS